MQRILRDQLSSDFTAIRVDNEFEYERIVDFVNRFAPKLVNRVKLYTKETPILEHYGVQHGVKIARKHVAWYSKGLYGSNEFRTRINFMDDPQNVEAAILDFYTPQIERAAA